MILQSLFDRLTLRGLFRRFRFDAFEELRELSQRIVNANVAFKASLVVDQLARDFKFLLADAIQRLDLARVHNRCVEAGLNCVVQKHRVQHHSRRRIETKRDVRNA